MRPRLRGLAAAGLLCGGLLLAQSYRISRDLIGRVQEDVRRSSGLNRRSDKEKERADNAERHLSEFDKNLRKGRFDKGKLDRAIDDVKNVVEHNTLTSQDRDALSADLRDLRELRERRGQ